MIGDGEVSAEIKVGLNIYLIVVIVDIFLDNKRKMIYNLN